MSDLNFISMIHLIHFRSLATLLRILILGLASSHSVSAATVVIPTGGHFQAALNAAAFGDTMVLQMGATYHTANRFEAAQQCLKELFDIVDFLFVKLFLLIIAVMAAVSYIRHHYNKMKL
jgi:hypothetical protein